MNKTAKALIRALIYLLVGGSLVYWTWAGNALNVFGFDIAPLSTILCFTLAGHSYGVSWGWNEFERRTAFANALIESDIAKSKDYAIELDEFQAGIFEPVFDGWRCGYFAALNLNGSVDLSDNIGQRYYLKQYAKKHPDKSFKDALNRLWGTLTERGNLYEAKARQAHGKTAPGKTLTRNSEEALKGEAAAVAAEIVGVDRSTVYDAQNIAKESPELFDEVKSGKKTLNKAKDELKRLLAPRRENAMKILRWSIAGALIAITGVFALYGLPNEPTITGNVSYVFGVFLPGALVGGLAAVIVDKTR